MDPCDRLVLHAHGAWQTNAVVTLFLKGDPCSEVAEPPFSRIRTGLDRVVPTVSPPLVLLSFGVRRSGPSGLGPGARSVGVQRGGERRAGATSPVEDVIKMWCLPFRAGIGIPLYQPSILSELKRESRYTKPVAGIVHDTREMGGRFLLARPYPFGRLRGTRHF